MVDRVMTGPAFEADLRAFEERVIDLAISTEHLLIATFRALETNSDRSARWVLEVEGTVRQAYCSLRAQGLALQAHHAPVGGALTRLIELQKALSDFEHITEHCQRAARHVLTLASTQLCAELLRPGDASLALLSTLRRQMRGVIVALVKEDRQQKQQLIAEAQVVGNHCAVAVVQLQERIGAEPTVALSLTRLLFVVYELRCIHQRLTTIGHGAPYSAAAAVSAAASLVPPATIAI
jgi:hypothetical protein